MKRKILIYSHNCKAGVAATAKDTGDIESRDIQDDEPTRRANVSVKEEEEKIFSQRSFVGGTLSPIFLGLVITVAGQEEGPLVRRGEARVRGRRLGVVDAVCRGDVQESSVAVLAGLLVAAQSHKEDDQLHAGQVDCRRGCDHRREPGRVVHHDDVVPEARRQVGRVDGGVDGNRGRHHTDDDADRRRPEQRDRQRRGQRDQLVGAHAAPLADAAREQRGEDAHRQRDQPQTYRGVDGRAGNVDVAADLVHAALLVTHADKAGEPGLADVVPAQEDIAVELEGDALEVGIEVHEPARDHGAVGPVRIEGDGQAGEQQDENEAANVEDRHEAGSQVALLRRHCSEGCGKQLCACDRGERKWVSTAV
eukprot:m.60838 g.60838  ORF g.60838 m.60838 type:complete len:365 (-) comp13688_c0_seq1:52-1146(-)